MSLKNVHMHKKRGGRNMRDGTVLLKNTAVLAGGEILMRAVSLGFSSFLARKAGAENVGIYGLIMSVYLVFATVSLSGIRFAATRLCAQQIGFGNLYPRRLMRRAFFYALFFGALSCAAMFFSAPFAARKAIGAAAMRLPLEVLSATLPCLPLRAAAEGYFAAKEKNVRVCAVQLLNQCVSIAVTVWLLPGNSTAEHICTCISCGAAAGDFVSMLIVLFCYFSDVRGKKDEGIKNGGIAKTAFPLAVSSYMRIGLSSAGHILIPFGLKKSGASAAQSFAVYGIIHQMAFPVITFPAAALAALGDILIPKLTGAQVCGKKLGISYMASRSLRLTLVFGCFISGFMFFFADGISMAVYKSSEAARYIRMFAPLVTVMYLDDVTDICLKGLGQQLHSMLFNILEAILNLVLLTQLLPRYAIDGYIFTIYIKVAFNFALSIGRLSHITPLGISPRFAAVTFAIAALSGAAARITGGNAAAMLYAAYYFMAVYIADGVSGGDVRWIISLIFKKNPEQLLTKV